MKTTADNGRPQRTSRRRRAAAAILLACATTTAGAAIGTTISRPAAASPPACSYTATPRQPTPLYLAVVAPDKADVETFQTGGQRSPEQVLIKELNKQEGLRVFGNSVFDDSSPAKTGLATLNQSWFGRDPYSLIMYLNTDSTPDTDSARAIYSWSTHASDPVEFPSKLQADTIIGLLNATISKQVNNIKLNGSKSWTAKDGASSEISASYVNALGASIAVDPTTPIVVTDVKITSDGESSKCTSLDEKQQLSLTFPLALSRNLVAGEILTVDYSIGFPTSDNGGSGTTTTPTVTLPAPASASDSPGASQTGEVFRSASSLVSTCSTSSTSTSTSVANGTKVTTTASPSRIDATATTLDGHSKEAWCGLFVQSPDTDRTDPPKTKNSPLGIAGGGLAGLLVGAGAGAALMATRRKNDGGPDGRHMAGQSFAGPPPDPYGLGGTPRPGVPRPGMPAGTSPGGGTNFGAAATSATAAGAGAVAAGAAAGVASSVGSRGHGVNAISSAAAANHEWTVAAPGGSTVRLEDIGVARVMPTVTEHGRTWAVGSPDYGATAGWLEKRKGKGEDAEPTMRIHSSGRGIIGVYDGTGGAGAAVARTTGDGTELSAAYVAARLVRDVVEAWFVDCVDDADRALETAGLAATLQRVLNEEAQYLPSSKSNVRGKLHRVLPTTAACVAFDSAGAGGTIDALWAGDSRCFALTAGDGLQVLSRDDTRESDALELIRNDQPMENLVAADRPFRINHRRFAVDAPLVLVTATDGAFGYVRTPAHFEYLLLHALERALTIDDWSAGLLAAFSEFAADDVSFSIVALGFSDFAGLQQAMRSRHDYLAREHWQPFVDKSGDADAIERLRIESWDVYRDLYQARLNGPDAAVAADARPEGQ